MHDEPFTACTAVRRTYGKCQGPERMGIRDCLEKGEAREYLLPISTLSVRRVLFLITYVSICPLSHT